MNTKMCIVCMELLISGFLSLPEVFLVMLFVYY